jgi:hypothetical protein
MMLKIRWLDKPKTRKYFHNMAWWSRVMGLKENITFLSFTTFKLLLCVQYTFPVSYGGGHLCVPQSFFFFRCFFLLVGG